MNWQTEREGKTTIIVYDFPKAPDHQSDYNSFADLCNSVFKNINKMLHLGKKVCNFLINIDPYRWALKIMRTKVDSFLVHICCDTMISIMHMMCLLLLTKVNLEGKSIGS